MLSLTIKDLKQFMNKLLISDTFDGMCLSEAYICTGCSYTIDGKLNTDFYNEDELNSMPSARYTSWKNIKPFAFSIIKGRKVPELLKITFVLPEAVVAKLILDTDLNFDPDCVNGLFLNVRYQDGSVTMTTASSLSTFTLDRSLDEAFERYIINLCIKLTFSLILYRLESEILCQKNMVIYLLTVRIFSLSSRNGCILTMISSIES